MGRPGCVSIYAILQVLGGVVVLFLGISAFPDYLVTSLLALVGALSIAIGVGLWYLKRWGWWLVMIFAGLQVLGGLIALFRVEFRGLISLVIGAIILYWFGSNDHLFGG